MPWWVALLGAGLVLVVLRDVFHTLWHPSGHGRLSRTVMRAVWRASSGRRRRVRAVAGPLTMLTVIGMWTALMILGWALVYWPSVPEGFSFDPALHPPGRSNLVDAVYVSMVTLATLGFGDIVPTPAWLRIVMPLEALMGFMLLTAAVSWILQIYPALTRRRAVASRIALVRRAQTLTAEEGAGVTPTLLDDLTAGVIQARVDLTQYGETYYFNDHDPDTSLAAALPFALDLARWARRSGDPGLRLAGVSLCIALDDLALLLNREFLEAAPSTTPAVLDAYTAAHAPQP